jgi:hypothetical protein
MPTINSYRVTIVRENGETSSMRVLALTLVDAQRHVERNLTVLTDYTSLTVERMS